MYLKRLFWEDNCLRFINTGSSTKQLTANKLWCSGCLSVSVPSFDYCHLCSFSKEKNVPELLNVQSQVCTKMYDLVTKTDSTSYFDNSK